MIINIMFTVPSRDSKRRRVARANAVREVKKGLGAAHPESGSIVSPSRVLSSLVRAKPHTCAILGRIPNLRGIFPPGTPPHPTVALSLRIHLGSGGGGGGKRVEVEGGGRGVVRRGDGIMERGKAKNDSVVKGIEEHHVVRKVGFEGKMGPLIT